MEQGPILAFTKTEPRHYHFEKIYKSKKELKQLLKNPADRNDLFISGILPYTDTLLWAAGMDDIVAAEVDCYVTFVTEDVARCCLSEASHLKTGLPHGAGGSGKPDPEMTINLHDKTRAICAFCQAGSTILIRIAPESHGKGSYPVSHRNPA